MKFVYAAVVLISFAGLGYLAGKGQGFREGVLQAPQQEMRASSMTPEDEKNWKELKDRLQNITPEEIREYLRTQNAEEKLKKADEILGKIVQALVANIGFRLQPDEVSQLNGSPVIQRETPPAQEPVVEAKPAKKKDEKDTARVYQKLRRQIQIAGTEEEAQKILTELPQDYATRIQASLPLTQQQLNQLRGHFEGTLTYLKESRSVRTTLDFSGKIDGDRVIGSGTLVLYDNLGKPVSTGSSNGELNTRYSGTPVSVVISMGGNYFELIYFRNLNMWMGNYLENQKGQFVKTGTVVYQR